MTLVVRSFVVPSVNVPVAVNGSVCPTNTVGDCGESVSVTSSAEVTTTVALAEPPLRLAVMVEEPSPTENTGKSAPSAPAGMGTVAGTVATAVLLLVSDTVCGSVEAGETATWSTPGVPLGTVTVLGASPVTTVGGGVTWTVALALVLLSDAVTVALPGVNTVTGNVTLVCPAGTVTEPGAWSTLGALFVSGMTVSATCAALIVRVKPPVAPCWIASGFGNSDTTVGGGGITWTCAVCVVMVVALRVAVTAAFPTATPVTVKLAWVWPDGNVTLAGIWSTLLLSTLRDAVVFVDWAAFSVTVRVPVALTTTVSGEGSNETSAGARGVTWTAASALELFRLAVTIAVPNACVPTGTGALV